MIHFAYHAGPRLCGGVTAAGLVLPQTGRFGFAQGVLQILAGLAVILLGLDILGKLLFALVSASPPWRGRGECSRGIAARLTCRLCWRVPPTGSCRVR
jgi:hypothetical protein